MDILRRIIILSFFSLCLLVFFIRSPIHLFINAQNTSIDVNIPIGTTDSLVISIGSQGTPAPTQTTTSPTPITSPIPGTSISITPIITISDRDDDGDDDNNDRNDRDDDGDDDENSSSQSRENNEDQDDNNQQQLSSQQRLALGRVNMLSRRFIDRSYFLLEHMDSLLGRVKSREEKFRAEGQSNDQAFALIQIANQKRDAAENSIRAAQAMLAALLQSTDFNQAAFEIILHFRTITNTHEAYHESIVDIINALSTEA